MGANLDETRFMCREIDIALTRSAGGVCGDGMGYVSTNDPDSAHAYELDLAVFNYALRLKRRWSSAHKSREV